MADGAKLPQTHPKFLLLFLWIIRELNLPAPFINETKSSGYSSGTYSTIFLNFRYKTVYNPSALQIQGCLQSFRTFRYKIEQNPTEG